MWKVSLCWYQLWCDIFQYCHHLSYFIHNLYEVIYRTMLFCSLGKSMKFYVEAIHLSAIWRWHLSSVFMVLFYCTIPCVVINFVPKLCTQDREPLLLRLYNSVANGRSDSHLKSVISEQNSAGIMSIIRRKNIYWGLHQWSIGIQCGRKLHPFAHFAT